MVGRSALLCASALFGVALVGSCTLSFDPALLASKTDAAVDPGGDARVSCIGAADGAPCAGGTCVAATCCTGCVDDRGACNAKPTVASCGWQGKRCALCVAPLSECVEEVAGCAPARRVVSVSLGGWFHSCAVDHDGGLFCWGGNPFGELGLGTTGEAAAAPTHVGTSRWRAVATGGVSSAGHSCAIAEDGALWCWGQGTNGELGLGSNVTSATAPTKVDAGPWTALALGAAASCGVRNGRLTCWGDSTDGRLNLPATSAFVVTPTDTPLVGVTALSLLSVHGVGLVGDAAYTWGFADERLGRPGPSVPAAPVGSGYGAVAAGAQHGCGIRSGELWCWGTNARGELGLLPADLPSAATPRRVLADSADWVQVGCGDGFTCGMRATGAILCWGRNDSAQLGRGSLSAPANAETPDNVVTPDGVRWQSLAVGVNRACAVSSVGALYCWGDGRENAVGVPGVDLVTKPTTVVLP